MKTVWGMIILLGLVSCSSSKNEQLTDPVRELIVSRLDIMRHCYVNYAKKTKNYKPFSSNLSFRVNKDGSLSNIRIEGDKKYKRNAYMSKCIAGILKKESLGDALGGKVVDVSQPLTLGLKHKK